MSSGCNAVGVTQVCVSAVLARTTKLHGHPIVHPSLDAGLYARPTAKAA